MPLIERKDFPDHSFIGIWEVLEAEEDLLRLYPATEDELILLNSFTHPYRKQQFLATRLLLHTLVPDGRIIYDEHGKPFLQHYIAGEHEKHISVSHTGNLIAIQVADYSCGTDIERIRPKIERIASKFLSDEELPFALQEPATERLYVYWCVKEALYKVYGKKNVSLKTNIFVHQVSDTHSGETLAVLNHEGKRIERLICYERFGECMIAWTTNKGE